jgi:ATP-dependent DNA helicase PIF1
MYKLIEKINKRMQEQKQLNSTKPVNVTLLPQQKEAYNLMETGKNLFLTGKSGTGKSTIIKMFVQLYADRKIIALTSTTGTSAILIGGTTVYSYLGIGLGTDKLDVLVNKIKSRKYLKNRWCTLDTLIIDEISMFPPQLFDKLEEIARIIRRNCLPFGGIQLILSGDFMQLPCIKCNDFCFESKSWNECIKETIYLIEVIRQSDKVFQDCLNDVRIGRISRNTKEVLNKCINKELINEFGIKPTKIFTTNREVDKINDLELDLLAEKGEEFYEYNMQTFVYPGIKNKQLVIDKYEKSCLAPKELQLCVGAQVMLLYNMDLDLKLANGSRGVVTRFVSGFPCVKFLNGVDRIIDFHPFEYEENGDKTIRITQLPLKIAFATTIWKAQGLTIDLALIDLSNCFEYGEAYVALSRVKNLDGLSISSIDYSKIIAHPKALEYYDNLEKNIQEHFTPITF